MTGLPLQLVAAERRFDARVALSPVDLSVPAGQALALMGPNGSGKSTLLRLAAGRDEPTSGSVLLDGKAFTEDDEWVRRQVAVLPDEGVFYPDLSVREHLWLVAAAHGAGDATAELVDRQLQIARLDDHADEYPRNLSSGQAQQLLIASVLVRPRRLLILDEPERRLDPA